MEDITMKRMILACTAFLALLLSLPAAALDLAIVGGVNKSATAISPDDPAVQTSGGTGIGFGLLASTDLVMPFSIQAGVLRVSRKNTLKAAGLDNTTTTNFYEIPVVARISLLDMFSAGAGLYYGFASGDVNVKNNPTNAEANVTYEGASLKKSDLGLVASAAIKIPMMPKIGFLTDVRYLFGLSNLRDASDTRTVKTRDLEVLAGVSINL
jgi:hypothetical protein